MSDVHKIAVLQTERDYILFKIGDLERREAGGLHPTDEKRRLMNHFECINGEIQQMISDILSEEDPLELIRDKEIDKAVNMVLKDGKIYGEEEDLSGDHAVVVFFLKE